MAQRTPPKYITGLVPRLLRPVSQGHVKLYRLLGGRVVGGFGKLKLCLLTTTERKSGEPRTTPLLYYPDGDTVILVAAQGGLPAHPGWYWNIQDDPHVQIMIGSTERAMVARTATDAEREALWPRLTAYYKGWADYQSWTDRVIPVVICEPGPGAADSE